MRTTSAASLMLTATFKCKWDDRAQLTVLCVYLENVTEFVDFEQLITATEAWMADSGLPRHLITTVLCLTIDELEAAPDFKGEGFESYIHGLMEAQGVSTPADEKKKPKVAPTGKKRGRPRKNPEVAPQTTQKGPKGVAAPAPVRSATQKFPAGTVSTKPAPVVAELPSRPSSTVTLETGISPNPAKVMLVGYLDQPFADITREMLALPTTSPEQRLGALMAQQRYDLPNTDGLELVLELVNSRPKPAVEVYIRRGGKTLVNKIERDYMERYEIAYQNTLYKILPPGG